MKNQYKVRTIICQGCGKEIAKRMPAGRKYCSLDCYRKSKHPQRKTGKIVKCEWCNKRVYKSKVFLECYKHHFCSRDCANKWQARNKKEFVCKVCGKKFKLSNSLVKQKGRNPTYCSIACREKDPEYMGHINGNLAQQNKKGLNKLELAGRKILQDLKIEFKEQVLMFNKFLVDVLIPNKNLIIQWDGEYWHNRPERKKLDKSQDAYLRKCGYKVLRFTDNDIKNNKEKVYDNIRKSIQ